MNKERKKESHIIVALDRMRPEKALELASLLNGKVWGFKANDLLDQMGPEDCINKLSQYGNVMADPKFCDIPNTLKNRMPPYRKANIVTVMACSGKEALRAAIENSGGAKIAAVTVLWN